MLIFLFHIYKTRSWHEAWDGGWNKKARPGDRALAFMHRTSLEMEHTTGVGVYYIIGADTETDRANKLKMCNVY